MTNQSPKIEFNFLKENFKYLKAYSEEDSLRIKKKLSNANNDVYFEKRKEQENLILVMNVRKQYVNCTVKIQELKNKDYKIELSTYAGKEDEHKYSFYMSSTHIYNFESNNLKDDKLESTFLNLNFLKECIQAYKYTNLLNNNEYKETKESIEFRKVYNLYKELNDSTIELLKNIKYEKGRYSHYNLVKSKISGIEIFITRGTSSTYDIVLKKDGIYCEMSLLKKNLKLHSNIMRIDGKSYSNEDLKKIYPELYTKIYKEITKSKNLMEFLKLYVDESQDKNNILNIESIVKDPKEFLEFNYLIKEAECVRQVIKQINTKNKPEEKNVI